MSKMTTTEPFEIINPSIPRGMVKLRSLTSMARFPHPGRLAADHDPHDGQDPDADPES